MRWSNFYDVSEIELLMSHQLAKKWVRPKVFYYAYIPITHIDTTGSDMQLKRSCHLGHSLFCEAKTLSSRVLRFSQISDKRSCVITCGFWRPLRDFGTLFKLLVPSKNLHRGSHGPHPPCQQATGSRHNSHYENLKKNIQRVFCYHCATFSTNGCQVA